MSELTCLNGPLKLWGLAKASSLPKTVLTLPVESIDTQKVTRTHTHARTHTISFIMLSRRGKTIPFRIIFYATKHSWCKSRDDVLANVRECYDGNTHETVACIIAFHKYLWLLSLTDDKNYPIMLIVPAQRFQSSPLRFRPSPSLHWQSFLTSKKLPNAELESPRPVLLFWGAQPKAGNKTFIRLQVRHIDLFLESLSFGFLSLSGGYVELAFHIHNAKKSDAKE